VKPVTTLGGFGEHYARIEDSRAVAPVWLVGAALFYPDKAPGQWFSGVMGWTGGFDYWDWQPVTLHQIAAQTALPCPPTSDAVKAWTRASNSLQWKRM
jgi:hypothetical protein